MENGEGKRTKVEEREREREGAAKESGRGG